MRKRIFEIIGEVSDEDSDKLSHGYDMAMIVVIIASLIPMMFKHTNFVFEVMTWIATAIFIADYILRLLTADYKLGKGALSFVLYPFTPMAIVDLLSILPTFYLLAAGFRTLRVLRLVRALRVVRMLKFFRYSRDVAIITRVLRRQKRSLIAVCILAFGYVMLCSLIMFNVEPDTFDNYFEAIYWASVSLTTIGYGDIYPMSDFGRFVSMLSSFIGIAVVALPAGIITAGYTHEIQAQLAAEEDSLRDDDLDEL
ncbi:MAG: ion transporter [Oscillospiraceae bacterium]|nr:ion transporter [Oscillospiraceae bacterium]